VVLPECGGIYAGMLERHGLEVRQATLFDRPTVLEEGERELESWIRMFRQTFVEKMGEAKAQRWIRLSAAPVPGRIVSG